MQDYTSGIENYRDSGSDAQESWNIDSFLSIETILNHSHQPGSKEEPNSPTQFNFNTGNFNKGQEEVKLSIDKLALEGESQAQIFKEKAPKIDFPKKRAKIRKYVKKSGHSRVHRSSREPKQYKERVHLDGRRRTQRHKSMLQLSVKDGYWTKNILPFGKNHHIQFIKMMKGKGFFKENPWLKAIKVKDGIAMGDFERMYKQPELQNVWIVFFSQKILYRQLMLSRVKPTNRLIYVKFLEKFQVAFQKKKFLGISRKISENQYSKYYAL